MFLRVLLVAVLHNNAIIQSTDVQKQYVSCGRCICFTHWKEIVANCTYKNLDRVPPGIPYNITTLLLNVNNFTHLKKYEFHHFTKLTYLDIGFNRISFFDKDSFAGLNSLVNLSLESNAISCGTNLSGVFKPLNKLQTLKLNGNIKSSTCGYPANSLSTLSSLIYLYIDGQNASFGEDFLNLKNLTHLHLSDSDGYCRVGNLNNDTFTNVPSLINLNISRCNLKHIDWNALSHLRKMKVLDISENPGLGLDALERVTFGLRQSAIQELHINQIVSDLAVCVIVYRRIIQNLRNTSLRELHADRNRIEIFSNGALTLLPKTLTKMYLRQNRFTFGPYLKEMKTLTGLEEIDISGKHGSHDLPIINSATDIVDKLQECSNRDICDAETVLRTLPIDHLTQMDNAGVVPPRTYHVPPNLKRLKCTYSKMSYHISEVTFENNSIIDMDLSSNLFSTWIGPVHGLENLKSLDLSNNIARNVSMSFFHDFTGLERLNLSYNFLGLTLARDNGETFSKLKNLRVLDLSKNFVTKLQPHTFSGLTSLQVLDLSDNNIHSLFIKVYHLQHLQVIRCVKNQVRWIPRYLINDLDDIAKVQSITLDLSDNPIACTCENLHFLNWLMTSNVQFGNLSNYFCMYNNGRKRQFKDDLDDIYDDLHIKCYNHFAIALGVVSLFILSVSVMLYAVAYRYRWKLRYWYYAARLRYSRPAESCAQDEFEFDAFVSFADEDRDFVVGDLVEKLEDEAGLRLNIHQRDFTAGRSIAQNIVNAVQVSRRTLIILSEDFLASSWCRYELEMANMERVTTERDVILIIMYRSIQSKDMPAEISYHIKNDSYIQYPHQGRDDVFWKSLTDSLKL